MLLTVPYDEVGKVLAPVGADLAGKTLVDLTNPITSDRRRLIVGHTTSGAEEIAREFPTANVVKAFNAVFAEVYQSQNAQIDGHAITVFFAGDTAGAKAQVRELIVRLGFDAVDAGPLENARYLEPLSMLKYSTRTVSWAGYPNRIRVAENHTYSFKVLAKRSPADVRR